MPGGAPGRESGCVVSRGWIRSECFFVVVSIQSFQVKRMKMLIRVLLIFFLAYPGRYWGQGSRTLSSVSCAVRGKL